MEMLVFLVLYTVGMGILFIAEQIRINKEFNNE